MATRSLQSATRQHESSAPMTSHHVPIASQFAAMTVARGTFIIALFRSGFTGASSAAENSAGSLHGSSEIETLQHDFPVLAKLLMSETPWEQDPGRLANAIFARPPKIAQGSAAYPLLFQDQREKDAWPGEKVFDHLSYESEYYVFDRVHPIIKLHVGRPLVFAMQHGRVEAVAASRGGTAQFPFLDDPSAIPPLLKRLD